MRVFAYGGGWQSNAALVLAAEGKIDYQTFLFCNVGDDSEDPATLAYVRDHAMPYAAAHGIELHELQRHTRDGNVETLFGRLTKEGGASLPIPVYFSGGVPGSRACTSDFKIRVIGKWVKQHGATAASPATIGIGISVDEIERASNRRQDSHERIDYPLLDLRVRRSDCPDIMRRAGLRMPPKSSCWFCPYHKESTWITMRRERPELFGQAVELERALNRKREAAGKDHVHLTRFSKPIDVVIGSGQEVLDFDDGSCDSGYCFT